MKKSPSDGRKFASYTLKLLTTAIVWIGTAILAKLRLAPDANTIQSTLQSMPLWALLMLLVFFPLAWLCVEFVASCFLEFRSRLLESSPSRVVDCLMSASKSVWHVVGQWSDRLENAVGQHKLDGRYKKRVAQECRGLHNQTGLLNASAEFSLDDAYTEICVAHAELGEIRGHLLSSTVRGSETVYDFLRRLRPGNILALLGRPVSHERTGHDVVKYAADGVMDASGSFTRVPKVGLWERMPMANGAERHTFRKEPAGHSRRRMVKLCFGGALRSASGTRSRVPRSRRS